MTEVWVLTHTAPLASASMLTGTKLRGIYSTFDLTLKAAQNRDEITGPVRMDATYDEEVELKMVHLFITDPVMKSVSVTSCKEISFMPGNVIEGELII